MAGSYTIASHHVTALLIHTNRGIESLLQGHLIDHWISVVLLGHYVSLKTIFNLGTVDRLSIILNGIEVKQERVGWD